MKKFLCLVFPVFLFCSSLLSQNTYYDVLQLKSVGAIGPTGKILIDTTNKDIVLPILALYMGKESASFSEIYLYYNSFEGKDNNPFIEIEGTAQSNEIDGDAIFGRKQSGIFSRIGSTDVTNFSQGVSLFLIERAKQELTIAFFQRFKNFIEKYPEVKSLFPNTANTLGNLLAYQYTQMLPVLQEAFHKDMDTLPNNLLAVMLMDKYYEKLNKFPEFFVVLRSIGLLQQLDNLAPPAIIDSLPGIAQDFKKFTVLTNLHSALELTSILSNSIRTRSSQYDDDLKNYWISSDAFYNDILGDPASFNLFLGLVYQMIKNNNIEFKERLLVDQIKNNEQNILWFKTQFSSLLVQVGKINTAARSIKQLKVDNSKPSNQDIYTYINTTIDLFEFGHGFISHFIPESKGKDFDKYIGLTKDANSLYINIVSQNYALAMNSAINIFDSFSGTLNQKDTTIKNGIFDTKVIAILTTYGTFVANIADANSPEEVQSAIEAAALPVGSSSFKKNHINNIALNAYLGVNAGNWPKDNSPSPTWNANYRLTAPIGIAWTPIICKKRNGSLSLFASILDVGAIVDYQLKNESTGKEINQKIYLANILSPGGYLVYGLPWNLPVSLGFGGQYGPGLIKLGDNLWNPSWKWNFFIGVDIPIFNFVKGRGITKKG